MTVALLIVLYHVIFVLALLCLRTKTKPNNHDTVYTLYAGPVSFVVVR